MQSKPSNSRSLRRGCFGQDAASASLSLLLFFVFDRVWYIRCSFAVACRGIYFVSAHPLSTSALRLRVLAAERASCYLSLHS